MRLELDRMRLDDVARDPERLAAAIHDQLPALAGPVPVREIALALDIVEIREEPLTSLEGALITSPERSDGAILVNSRSSLQRQRYTIGHELGHFLNPWHQPVAAPRFECTAADMDVASGTDRHLRQEAEANRFSIALLAPVHRVCAYLTGPADLRQALAMARELDISKAAAVRRYAALHPERLTVVFSHEGRVRYVDRRDGFPHLSVWSGAALPVAASCALDWIAVDPRDWLTGCPDVALFAQTLHQADGYAITLVRTA